VVLDQVQINFG